MMRIHLIHPGSLTARPWRMVGLEDDFLSHWVSVTFSGAIFVKLRKGRELYRKLRLGTNCNSGLLLNRKNASIYICTFYDGFFFKRFPAIPGYC